MHLVRCVWPARLLHDAAICVDLRPFVCICWGRFNLAQPDQTATVFLSLCVLFNQPSLPQSVSIYASVSLPLCICLARLAPVIHPAHFAMSQFVSTCVDQSKCAQVKPLVEPSERAVMQMVYMCNVSYDSK